jgi:hypothetical protein
MTSLWVLKNPDTTFHRRDTQMGTRTAGIAIFTEAGDARTYLDNLPYKIAKTLTLVELREVPACL